MHVKKVQCKLMKKKNFQDLFIHTSFFPRKINRKENKFSSEIGSVYISYSFGSHSEYLAQFFNVSSGPTAIQNPRKC